MMGFGFGLRGRSGKNSGFDPATLSLTGWWRAPYGGSPWVALASAGSSGSNGNMTEATNPPSVGASLNSLASADFDGTNDVLSNANNITTFFATTRWSFAALLSSDIAPVHTTIYDNPAFVTDFNGAVFTIAFSNSGVSAGHYDGAYKEVTKACATGTQHIVQAWYDGTNISLSVDAGAASTVAASSVDFVGGGSGVLQFGRNYNSTVYEDGRLWEVMLSNTDLGATARTNIDSYFHARYAF